MKYARMYGLQPADRVIESIFWTGLSKHHSIYLGVDRHGVEWISENAKFRGVQLVKATDFFRDGKDYQIQKFTGKQWQRDAAVKRALSIVGAPYDLIFFNCEHSAEYTQTGRSFSKQVDWVKNLGFFVFITVFIGSVIYLLANSKESK